MVVVLGLGVALGGRNALQMSGRVGSPLGSEIRKQARGIAELPGLQGMEQPHRGFLAAKPVAAAIYGVGLAPAPAPGIQPIAVAAVATETPSTRQQWCPAPARELPTALDVCSHKGFAAAPVLAAIRETLARGGIKKPIRR